MFTARLINELLKGIGETLYMTLFSTFLAYVIGLPIGVALCVTDKNGIRPCKLVNAVLGTIVNVIRSVPFIILCISLMLGLIHQRWPKSAKYIALSLMTAALILFIAFYPLESGYPVAESYARYLRWFKWYNY